MEAQQSPWGNSPRPGALVSAIWPQYIKDGTIQTQHELQVLVASLLNCISIAEGIDFSDDAWAFAGEKVAAAGAAGLGWGEEDFAMWFYREFGAWPLPEQCTRCRRHLILVLAGFADAQSEVSWAPHG